MVLNVNMEKARNLVQDLYMRHAIKGEGGHMVTYKKEEIIELFKENGFTEEEARELLEKYEGQVMLPYFRSGDQLLLKTPENRQETQIIPLYTMIDECDLANYYLNILSDQLSEKYNADPEKYIMEGTFDAKDETEELLRSIFAESKTNFLQKYSLIRHLMAKGDLKSEKAKKIIEVYQERYILRYEERYVELKQYRLRDISSEPLSLIHAFQYAVNYEGNETQVWVDEDILLYILIDQDFWEMDAKQLLEENNEILESRTTSVLREGYKITRLEELLIGWAVECEAAQEMMEEDKEGSEHATTHVRYRDVREIFKEVIEQKKKTLTYQELTEKIAEICGVTQKEADKAFWSTLSAFKIWPAWEKNKGKKWEEKEYWWGGSCDYFPPRSLEN